MWPSATPVTVACAAVHTLERADSGGTSAAVVLGLDDEVLLAVSDVLRRCGHRCW